MMKYFAIYWGEIMQHEPVHGLKSAKELRDIIITMLDGYYPISYWTITETLEEERIVFRIFRRHGNVLLVTLKARIVYRPADN